jgi:hypothetical protein
MRSALLRAAFAVTLAAAPLKLDGPATGATCRCSSAADCTCPRGQCQCKKCGAGAAPRLAPSVKGERGSSELPAAGQPTEARAGVML